MNGLIHFEQETSEPILSLSTDLQSHENMENCMCALKILAIALALG